MNPIVTSLLYLSLMLRKQVESIHGLPGDMLMLFSSFLEMPKLLQVAVPVVLALLCLIPTVDAPTRTGMCMQMNINTSKMVHHC